MICLWLLRQTTENVLVIFIQGLRYVSLTFLHISINSPSSSVTESLGKCCKYRFTWWVREPRIFRTFKKNKITVFSSTGQLVGGGRLTINCRVELLITKKNILDRALAPNYCENLYLTSK